MRHVFWIIGILVLFTVQLALGQSFPYAPNLVLLYLCVMIQYFTVRQTLPAVFAAGVLLDWFSALPDGVMVSALALALAASYWLTQALLPERLVRFALPLQALLATVLMAVAYYLIAHGLYLLGQSAWTDWRLILLRALPFHVILNMVFLYAIFWTYQFQAFAQNRLLKKA